MLSTFVRGKTFVVAVLVALFAGLALFTADYNWRGAAQLGGENCFVKVYGRCYRLQEVKRLAEFDLLARRLFMLDFQQALFGEDRQDRDPTDFVLSLIVLRKEAKKLGVEPTVEEAQKMLSELPIFQIQTFVDADYIRDNFLGPRGLTEGDLFQLAKDYLSWKRIQDLLESGVRVPDSEVERRYQKEFQQFTASLAEFDRGNFADKAEVTDADIKDYFEANRQLLMSDEKRALTRVLLKPPAESEEMTNEQKAQAKKDFGDRVNELYADLASNAAEFDQRVAALKAAVEGGTEKKIGSVEVTPIDAFARSSPPESLEGDENSPIVSNLFSRTRTTERNSVYIPERPGEDGSFTIFNISEIVGSRQLTLEEAKEQITEVLKNQKSDQLVNEAATAARGTIAEALEAGKSVVEAAKAAGVEVKSLKPFSEKKKPEGIESPAVLVNAAVEMGPNSVSQVLPRPFGKGYQLLLVDKIELVESETADDDKTTIRSRARGELRSRLFQAWFNKVRKASEAKRDRTVAPAEDQPPLNS